jgi:hypothetical protein
MTEKSKLEAKKKLLQTNIIVEQTNYGQDILFISDKYLTSPTEFNTYFLKRTAIAKKIIQDLHNEIISTNFTIKKMKGGN